MQARPQCNLPVTGWRHWVDHEERELVVEQHRRTLCNCSTDITNQLYNLANMRPSIGNRDFWADQSCFPYKTPWFQSQKWFTDIHFDKKNLQRVSKTHLAYQVSVILTFCNSHLTSVRISYNLNVILHFLRFTTSLVQFNLEASVVDAPHTHRATSDVKHDNTLIYLPHFTQLSLRIDSISYILPHLLLPNLTSLRIDNLDGKSIGSAEIVENLFRNLLIRMDFPVQTVWVAMVWRRWNS